MRGLNTLRSSATRLHSFRGGSVWMAKCLRAPVGSDDFNPRGIQKAFEGVSAAAHLLGLKDPAEKQQVLVLQLRGEASHRAAVQRVQDRGANVGVGDGSNLPRQARLVQRRAAAGVLLGSREAQENGLTALAQMARHHRSQARSPREREREMERDGETERERCSGAQNPSLTGICLTL
eukprot:scaffold803_cov310-Pinguiococcus_pyrenoidosus.AAC.132